MVDAGPQGHVVGALDASVHWHTHEVNALAAWRDRLTSGDDDASIPLWVIATGHHHHWTLPRDLCAGNARGLNLSASAILGVGYGSWQELLSLKVCAVFRGIFHVRLTPGGSKHVSTTLQIDVF